MMSGAVSVLSDGFREALSYCFLDWVEFSTEFLADFVDFFAALEGDCDSGWV
jgi:hypothetical protein